MSRVIVTFMLIIFIAFKPSKAIAKDFSECEKFYPRSEIKNCITEQLSEGVKLTFIWKQKKEGTWNREFLVTMGKKTLERKNAVAVDVNQRNIDKNARVAIALIVNESNKFDSIEFFNVLNDEYNVLKKFKASDFHDFEELLETAKKYSREQGYLIYTLEYPMYLRLDPGMK